MIFLTTWTVINNLINNIFIPVLVEELNRVITMPPPGKKLKASHGAGLMPSTRKDGIHKLSEYDLLPIFSWLDDWNMIQAALVCKQWKRIIYGMKTAWRSVNISVKPTTNMEIVAKSLLMRGTTELNVYVTENMRFSMDDPYNKKASQLTVSICQQISHLTRLMAESLVSLDLGDIKNHLNGEDVQRIFHRLNMPKLKRLYLARHFEVTEWTMKNITHNCCNLQLIRIPDCTVFKNGDSLQKIDLRKLPELSLYDSDNLSPIGCYNISQQLPHLRVLNLSSTCIKSHWLVHVANLRQLVHLDISECLFLSIDAIDVLSDGRSQITSLRMSHHPDKVMERIGMSSLTITHLALASPNFCASDEGIAALLRHGHRHYRSLKLRRGSKISRNGFIQLVNGVDVLEELTIKGKDKLTYAKSEAEKAEQSKTCRKKMFKARHRAKLAANGDS